MTRKFTLLSIISAALAATAFAQPSKVDFGRDVLPVFRQNCIACHGPAQATSGLRMDRKSSVFKDGLRRVVPGSSQNSFLYHRLIGTEYGLQMPPDRSIARGAGCHHQGMDRSGSGMARFALR